MRKICEDRIESYVVQWSPLIVVRHLIQWHSAYSSGTKGLDKLLSYAINSGLIE